MRHLAASKRLEAASTLQSGLPHHLSASLPFFSRTGARSPRSFGLLRVLSGRRGQPAPECRGGPAGFRVFVCDFLVSTFY